MTLLEAIGLLTVIYLGLRFIGHIDKNVVFVPILLIQLALLVGSVLGVLHINGLPPMSVARFVGLA